jgi:hypothetical protein
MGILSLFILLSVVMNWAALANENHCVIVWCGTCLDDRDPAAGHPQPCAIWAGRKCFKDNQCTRLKNGKCGWAQTPESFACTAQLNANAWAEYYCAVKSQTLPRPRWDSASQTCLKEQSTAINACVDSWKSTGIDDELTNCIDAIKSENQSSLLK